MQGCVPVSASAQFTERLPQVAQQGFSRGVDAGRPCRRGEGDLAEGVLCSRRHDMLGTVRPGHHAECVQRRSTYLCPACATSTS